MIEFGLLDYDVGVLMVDKLSVEYFEVVVIGWDFKLIVNWIMGDLFGVFNKVDLEIEVFLVIVEKFGDFLDLIGDQMILGKIVKQVF